MMFRAYNAEAGGKTWDGRPIPPWEEVGDKVHANWNAAARCLYELMSECHAANIDISSFPEGPLLLRLSPGLNSWQVDYIVAKLRDFAGRDRKMILMSDDAQIISISDEVVSKIMDKIEEHNALLYARFERLARIEATMGEGPFLKLLETYNAEGMANEA